MKKRIVALVLAASMIFELAPSSVIAAFADTNETATIGRPSGQASSGEDEDSTPRLAPSDGGILTEEPVKEEPSAVIEETSDSDADADDPATQEPATDPPGGASKVAAEPAADDKSGGDNESEGPKATYDGSGLLAVPSGSTGGPLKAVVNHTVTFVVEGEDPIEITVAQGSAIGDKMPDDPVKTVENARVVFDGWYVDGSEEDIKVTSGTIVTEDITAIARFTVLYTVEFDPNTEEGGTLADIAVEVPAGEPIGDRLPAVPEVPGYATKWVRTGTDTEVTSETIVNGPMSAVVGKDKIIYTVTFVQEDGTEETRTTSVTEGFAVNDLPAVAEKTNKIGKWVYQGTENEFTVGTVVSEDVTVEAFYEQNIFTVTYIVDNAQYEQMTTASGAKIILPSDPIKEGATFGGWFTEPNGQGTQYTEDDSVGEDLTLYAYFDNQVRVSFIVKDDEGNIISEKSQYFIDLTAGGQITTLPDEPFVAGKVFDHWEHETTHESVEVGTVVEDSFNAVAVFNSIDTYELTVKYYYMNGNERVDIQTEVYDLSEGDFPYTVTAPGFTIATEIDDDPTYYPSQPTITVEKADFTDNQKEVEIEYVPADAQYKVGHYLKNVDGNGYELIETVDKVGVKNSKVTPDIKSYSYADFESRDENVTITGDASQELKVYYVRRNFTLSYNVDGGEYIAAITEPYGTTITLPTTATRAGYTFGGWYKDAECTQSAGTSITLTENTTLHAKWEPTQVSYKIVYMLENANDDGYSFLKDVTRTAATDTELTLTKAQADQYAPSDLDKQNFTFKESTTETIKADGSSVIVVKYTRNVYTLQWQGNRYRRGNNGRWSWDTVSGRGSVTAKYGASITDEWIETFNTPYPNYAWALTQNNDDKIMAVDTMPGKGEQWGDSQTTLNFTNNVQTVYAFDFSTDKTQTLNYWLENYESRTTKTRDGKTYGLYKSVTGKFNYLYDNADFYAIDGYSKDGYEAKYISIEREWGWVGPGWWDYGWVETEVENNYTLGSGTPDADLNVDFYYAAASHTLSFYNYDGTLISTQQVKLNADISGYLTSNVPDAPMSGASWRGWFTDAEHSSPYGGGTKMPAGLVLYGDFQFPTRTLTFDSQGGTEVSAQSDEYGFYATKPADPTKDNYTFQGWFTAADETGSPYDWNQPVTEDKTIFAHWTQDTISYTVHYYEQDTTNSVLPDKVVSDPNFTEGRSITEEAPSVAGHVADKASQTIELSFDEEHNTITFYYYTIPTKIEYTVNYVLKDHPEIKVAESKTVTVDGTTSNVLEMAVEADKAYIGTQTSDADILSLNYRPVDASKELKLGLQGNVITFEYVSFTTSKITVNYYDMDGNSIGETEVKYVEKGDTFTLKNKAPEGYVYHHAYLDGTTTEPQATYQITGNEGNLKINVYYQRKLIIIANNKSKTYDGTALFSSFDNSSDFTVVGNMRGDVLTSVEFEGSQTDAGTSTTTPKNAQISKGAQWLTDPEVYYSIIYVAGSLTVKPVSVYISISADQWNTHSGTKGDPNYYTGNTFNVGFTNPGKQHFNDAPGSAYVSITSGQRDLFKAKYGDAIWSTLYGENGALISEKDAGTYTVTGAQQKAMLSGITVDGQSMMADPNYSITLYARDSFLKIDPLPITVTTGSATKAYDGTPLTKEEGATLEYSYWTANIGGTWTAAEPQSPSTITLLTGDKVEFSVIGSQTEVGGEEGNNTASLNFLEGAKSSNYKINWNLGTLVVEASPLTVVVNDKTVTYNGEEQYGYSFPATITGTGKQIKTDEYTVEGLGDGDVLTITYTPAAGTTVAGSPYTGSFATTFTITRGSGADAVDVTDFYQIDDENAFTPGKLTIKKATMEINIAGDKKEFTYDGTAKTASGFTATSENSLFD